MDIIKFLKFVISFGGLTFAIITLPRLIAFLSYVPGPFDTMTDSEGVSTAWALLVNISLLCIFILQHSLMADQIVKNTFKRYNLGDLERTLYVIMSCISLQVLVWYWHSMPWAMLWHVNINTSKILWWSYVVLHSYSWGTIYCGSLMMDVTELLGVKQVIYSNQGLPSVETYKSTGLKRLYCHMRHPSLTGLSIIFWIYPHMSVSDFYMLWQ